MRRPAPRRRRRALAGAPATGLKRAALAGSVALLSLVAASVSVADHGSLPGAPGPGQFDDPEIRLALAEARVRDEQRAQQRSTPDARAERQRSRRAYSGLGRADALALARAKHPDVLAARPWRPLVMRPGEHVERYLGDYSALVAVGDRTLLAESTLPLRALDDDGRLAPVVLDLEDRGRDLAPRNPLIDVAISKDPSEGISFERAGFTFGLDGAAAPEAPVVVDGKAFTANVLRDSDLVVQPMPSGVETFLVLRSIDSPESAALAFDLPADAELRAGSGGDRAVEIVRDGRRVARLEAPGAWDAEGEPIPVAYELDGRTVRLRFPHRERDLAYPVVVDPIVGDTVKENFNLDGDGNRTSCNGSDPFAGQWGFTESPAGYFPHYTSGDCSIRGLTVYAYAGVTYPDNAYGEWLWQAPRQSYIERADFGYVTTTNRQGTCTIEGIWSPSRANWDYGVWYDVFGNSGSSPTLRSSEACRDLSGNYKAHCVGASCIPGSPSGDATGTRANMMVFGMLKYGTATLTTYPVHRMEGATMWLYDYDVPYLTSVSHSSLPSGWTRSASVTTSVAAREPDPGLGVKYFNLYRNGSFLTQRAHGCVGDRHGRCPESWSSSFAYDAGSEPEGVNRYDVVPFDAIAKPGGRSSQWLLKVDRGGPTVTPSGSLWQARNQAADHRGEGLYDAEYALRVDAHDGSDASDAAARSGVARIDIEVRTASGSLVSSHPDPAPQGCAATRGSCPKARDWTFVSDDYADGDYTVVVAATDQVGNRSEQRFDVTVDRRGDVYHAEEWSGDPAAGGELISEEWGRYGTSTARREIADVVTTRSPVPCRDDEPSGPQCAEVRYRTLDSQIEPVVPGEQDSFTRYRGASEDDPHIEQVADILEPARFADAGEQAIARGPLTSVLEPWQIPPPDRGTEFELYEFTESEDTNSGEPDATTGEYPDETTSRPVTVRVWIDAKTRMPVRRSATTESETATSYWSYDRGRAEIESLPGDFFLVPAPAEAGMSDSGDYAGSRSIGETTDSQSGQRFTPYYLGPSVTVADVALCLDTAYVYRHSETTPRDDFGGEDDEATTRDLSQLTRVDALYGALPDGSTCVPGEGPGDEVGLEVSSFASASEIAGAYRDAIIPTAEAIQLDPTDGDFLIGGVSTFLRGTPHTVYVVPGDEGGTVGLTELSGTTILVHGAFGKADVPTLFSRLEPR